MVTLTPASYLEAPSGRLKILTRFTGVIPPSKEDSHDSPTSLSVATIEDKFPSIALSAVQQSKPSWGG
jgi:hypothetical protein